MPAVATKSVHLLLMLALAFSPAAPGVALNQDIEVKKLDNGTYQANIGNKTVVRLEADSDESEEDKQEIEGEVKDDTGSVKFKIVKNDDGEMTVVYERDGGDKEISRKDKEYINEILERVDGELTNDKNSESWFNGFVNYITSGGWVF